MSVLTLVRHGQASYMQADYDKLSATGEQQSRKLGEYWVHHGIRFDRVFHGPSKRHIRTMEIAGEIVQAAGMPWPEPQMIRDFDEFDAFTMMRMMMPVLIERSPEVRRLNDEFRANQHTPEAGRLLQKLFEAAAREWAGGAHEVQGVETWLGFRSRVAGAIDSLRTSALASSSTVVFTSGGPTAVAIAETLGLVESKAIEFVWLTRNCSYTQLLFSGGRLSLHAFNAIPHLDHLNLFTYR